MKALLVPATKQNTQLQLPFYLNNNPHHCNVCLSSFTWRQFGHTKLDPNKPETEMGKKTTHEKLKYGNLPYSQCKVQIYEWDKTGKDTHIYKLVC